MFIKLLGLHLGFNRGVNVTNEGKVREALLGFRVTKVFAMKKCAILKYS